MLPYDREQNSGQLLQGVVFVGSAEEEVCDAVELDVPFTAVVVCGRPESMT